MIHKKNKSINFTLSKLNTFILQEALLRNWEKIVVIHISVKGHVYRMYIQNSIRKNILSDLNKQTCHQGRHMDGK